MSYEQELSREALRVYMRYAVEVVERFDLCPWAERARLDGRTAERVIMGKNPLDFSASLAAIQALGALPETEVVLFIYPELELDRLAFDTFVRELRALDASRYEFGSGPFAMASFHPDAAADLGDPERLIPFLRRTPDPTIQLVRSEALDRVRGSSPQGTAFVDVQSLGASGLPPAEPPTLRERIARSNLETVHSAGVASLNALFEAIVRDRTEAYLELRAKYGERKAERA